MSNARKRQLALTVLLTASIVFATVLAVFPETVFASTLSFDETNVLDDLKSSTVDGKQWDITQFPYVDGKDIQVVNFVEFCYSYRANKQGNYGLYLYVYNPSALRIDTDSKGNKVQMAVSYDANGQPNDYHKFSLKFCNTVESGDYKYLFYKFRIVDEKVNGQKIVERVNSMARRYDISGIELVTYGNKNASEYGVGGSYVFTGYVAGYGPDTEAESTLNCSVEYLETLELEVKHTFYRTETSSKGAGFQNQLDTVYFAVPKRLLDEYGTLQRIKAEWYEYKTKDIVVTSNEDFYNKAMDFIGVQTGEFDSYGMTVYNKDIYYSLGQNAGDWGGGLNAASWGWNLGSGYLHTPCAILYYLFKTGDITAYDPYADITENGGVASNVLYDYIMNYNKTYANGTLQIKDGTISADLFESDIDDYRKVDNAFGKIQQGYSFYDFDADVDIQQMLAWSESQPSFWNNWIAWGLWDAIVGNIPDEESVSLAPIYTVKASDLVGTNEQVAARLYMNVSDVSDLRAYYQDAVTVSGKDDEEKVVVMFRFATTDYYSAAVDIIELGKGFLWSDKHTSGQAYRTYESVFLDFDIIQLTFNRDGEYRVIPVVSNPIDIVNGITPPVDFENMDWWKIILGVLCLVLLVTLLAPLLPYVIRFVIWIICLPFKAIARLIKNLRDPRRKVDRSLGRMGKQQEAKLKRTQRLAKKVDVGQLKQDIWSEKRKFVNLSDAEKYALQHDDEWLRVHDELGSQLYGAEDLDNL